MMQIREHRTRLLAGAYRMTGQRPTSIAREFVSSVIANVLIDVLAKSIDQIQVGYGEDSTATSAR